MLRGAENWIPKYASMAQRWIVIVAGSPRFRLYETDFGWGRPRKTEVVSIDRTEGLYIGDCKDEEGGVVEFGLAMPKRELLVFASFFLGGSEITCFLIERLLLFMKLLFLDFVLFLTLTHEGMGFSTLHQIGSD